MSIVLDMGLKADTEDEDDVDIGDLGDAVEVDLAFFRGLYL